MPDKSLYTLSEQLVSHADAKGLTFALAESCTGGLISKCITDISGASAVYPGGVCTYANSAKIKLLGVKSETLAKNGAVSEETAREMAAGVRKLFSCDIGISVTGIAGPNSDGTDKPVGLIYICADSGKKSTVIKLTNNFTEAVRERNRESAAAAALNAAIQIIED